MPPQWSVALCSVGKVLPTYDCAEFVRHHHTLKGEWADHRECHIGGDFLLIYQLQGNGNNAILNFVRAGTHAELFES